MTRSLHQWTCPRHPGEFLKDCVDAAGVISHQCKLCIEAEGDVLLVVNVPRQLHRRASEIGAGKESA